MYISVTKELLVTKMAESNEIIYIKHQVSANDEHEHSNAASEEEVIAKNYF